MKEIAHRDWNYYVQKSLTHIQWLSSFHQMSNYIARVALAWPHRLESTQWGGASPLNALEFRPIGPHLAPGIMKNERKMRGETQPPGHHNKFPIGEKVNKANSTVPVFCFCFCLQNKHRRRRHKIPKAFAVSSPVSLFISQSISERRTRTCCLIADDVEKVEDRCHRVP